MKTIRNLKRLAFALISTALLCCNLTKAAAYFDPLAGHDVRPLITPASDAPCIWDPIPDPGPITNPGAPDCVACEPCFVQNLTDAK